MRIDAVLFDMGGTIEDIRYDDGMRMSAARTVIAYLAERGIRLDASPEAVFASIRNGSLDYRAWSERTLQEAPARRVWREWYLRDYGLSESAIDRVADGLAVIWETEFHSRALRPEARETLESLAARGYRLGVISNTSSEEQVLGTLNHYGIRDFFSCVCLSCVSGIRKPDPRIFREALSLLGAAANRAAYVGDTVSRDVSGAKAAGYALAFQIRSFMTDSRDGALPPGCPKPDYVVGDLLEVVSILDRLQARSPATQED
jgi:putative hydrolase of the HAD superfamily